MFNNTSGIKVTTFATTNWEPEYQYSYSLKYIANSGKAKCPYCKQWGEARKQCEHCGAPIDPDED